MPKLFLKKNEERRIQSGHLWIFSNEIDRVEGSAENGDIVTVYDFKNNLIGSAFYNRNSLIAGRLLSREKITNTKEFLKNRILQAYQLRKDFYPGRESFRLVFSESDLLPGIIVDKYNNTFVLQVYSYGMQKNISLIAEILKEELSAENIFTKNESYFRKLEGLPEEDEVLLGGIKNELIDDGSVKYQVDFETGHKTGFYFDQSDNRFFIERLVKNKTVLDAFCNSGGFGLHASKAGALSVTFVDSSSAEIENAKRNYALNNFVPPADFIISDVFDFLEKCAAEKKTFDVVMIDPPAFAKNKKTLPQAKKGYEKLNRLALAVVSRNGFLVTSSCSHHLNKDEFIEVLNAASAKSRERVQLIQFTGASLDHPELPSMKETAYLKFAVLKKMTDVTSAG
ncbi:MAG: class I SAM-dependent rRNA methyltransferase [Ignavibacteriaceae bacterium]